jgi:hypothetical protein
VTQQRAHCDECGNPWFSNDGKCHLCRTGYSCRCQHPEDHKYGTNPAGCIFVAGIIAFLLALLGGLYGLIYVAS